MARERVEAIDAMRGLMAFGLMVYHYLGWCGHLDGLAGDWLLKKIGLYGVEIFFVISGYSMTYVYRELALEARAIGRFWLKRWFRIAPLFHLCALLSLAYKLAAGSHVAPWDVFANFTFLFGLIDPSRSLVVAGWSIGVEMVFYAVFPLFLLALRRPAGRALLLALTLGGLTASTLAIQSLGSGLQDAWGLYVSPLNHLFFFAGGGLGALFRERFHRVPPASAWRAWGPVVLLGLAFLLPGAVRGDEVVLVVGWRRFAYAFLSCAIVWALAFCRLREGPVRSGLLWLGEVSYSLYLLHPLVYFGLARGLARFASGHAEALALLAGGLTLGASTLTYRWLELPALEVGRKVLLMGRGAPPQPG